jgi:hypothetical protein
MKRSREVLVAAGMVFGTVLLSSASDAQDVGVAPAPPPVAEQQWASAPCETCLKAGVTFEVRRLSNPGHEHRAFIVARLRNLTQSELTGTIEVLDAELPDSEGHIPSQTLWFVLSPASSSDHGEQVVLLRSRTPVKVIAHAVAE